MARPCKSIEGQSRHNSKEDIEKRKETEEILKGLADKIEEPPDYLTDSQKAIYNFIIEELKPSGILSNLDSYLIAIASTSIDRIQYIDKVINQKPNALLNKRLADARDSNIKDFFRCCNELSLSPQSRAKFGSLALKAKEDSADLLLRALADDEE